MAASDATIEQYFQVLYPDVPAGMWLLVWAAHAHTAAKESCFARHWRDTLPFLSSHSTDWNLYMGVGLRAVDLGSTKAGREADIVAIPALWGDFDVGHAAHSKKNLPPTKEAVRSLFAAVPFAPTLTTWSGHGLHAYWCFRELWTLETEAERIKAKTLLMRFQKVFQDRARAQGWDVDSTFDLRRVLRIPGTLNCKPDLPPVGSSIESIDETQRTNPGDWDEVLPKWQGHVKLTADLSDLGEWPFVLNLDADPPEEKWTLLKINFPSEAKGNWEHTWSGGGDRSLSGFDFRLAKCALAGGWTAQETVDLLVAHRRYWFEREGNRKVKLKLERPDYYLTTLAKAGWSAAEEEATQTLAEGPTEEESPEEHRKRMLAAASVRFMGNRNHVRITRIIKYLSDPPQYRMLTNVHDITIGPMAALMTQSTFRARIGDATKRMPRSFPSKQWDQIVQTLLDVSEDEEVGDEATDVGKVREWIESYLAARTPTPDLNTAIIQNYPYEQNGRTLIFGSLLRQWLAIQPGTERISAREMGSLLRAYGCVPEAVAVQIKGRHSSRSAWVIPPQKKAERG